MYFTWPNYISHVFANENLSLFTLPELGAEGRVRTRAVKSTFALGPARYQQSHHKAGGDAVYIAQWSQPIQIKSNDFMYILSIHI